MHPVIDILPVYNCNEFTYNLVYIQGCMNPSFENTSNPTE